MSIIAGLQLSIWSRCQSSTLIRLEVYPRCIESVKVYMELGHGQGDKATRHKGSNAHLRHNIHHVASRGTRDSSPPVSARLGDVFSFRLCLLRTLFYIHSAGQPPTARMDPATLIDPQLTPSDHLVIHDLLDHPSGSGITPKGMHACRLPLPLSSCTANSPVQTITSPHRRPFRSWTI